MNLSPWLSSTKNDFRKSLLHLGAALPWEPAAPVFSASAAKYMLARSPGLSLQAVHCGACIELSMQFGPQTGEEATAELAELRERCSDQAKEREALHTILDAKIRALVKDVASTIQAIPNQVCLTPGSPSPRSTGHCTMRFCSTSVACTLLVVGY